MPTDASGGDGSEVRKAFTLERLARLIAFRRTLTSESDRGAALMAAAFLDVELKELLGFFFVDDKAIQERYFGYNGPGGSFSGRIDTAFLLGLISKFDHKDLTVIRKVRNDYAHVHEAISFDTPSIRDRCLSMSWCGDEVEGKPRDKYIRSAMAVTASIHSAYLLRTTFTERAHHGLTREDEHRLMKQRNELLDGVLVGKIDYEDIAALAKRMQEEAYKGRSEKAPE